MTAPILFPSTHKVAFQIVDLMDSFWAIFEQPQASSLDEKIGQLKSTIIEPNIKFYSCVFGLNEAGLRDYISETGQKITRLSSSQDAVREQINHIFARFQAHFPSFQTSFVTYLLPSLNLFKGMAIPFQEQIVLLLGADALSELSEHHFRGYLTHELFHRYHFQRVPAVRVAAELAIKTMKMPELWGLLWTEGLACRAVRVVYPEIPEEEILDWRPLVEQVRPSLPALAEEARRTLTSSSLQDIAGFFYFPRENNPHIPTGCGYYIGMLIADALAKKYSLDTLLELDNETLIREIDLALKTLSERENASGGFGKTTIPHKI
jgi:hypothetical protein